MPRPPTQSKVDNSVDQAVFCWSDRQMWKPEISRVCIRLPLAGPNISRGLLVVFRVTSFKRGVDDVYSHACYLCNLKKGGSTLIMRALIARPGCAEPLPSRVCGMCGHPEQLHRPTNQPAGRLDGKNAASVQGVRIRPAQHLLQLPIERLAPVRLRGPTMRSLLPISHIAILELRWLVAAHLGLLGGRHGLGVLLLTLGEVVEPRVL